MHLPTLPMDSPAKFLTISGIALVILATVYPDTMEREYAQALKESVIASETVNVEARALLMKAAVEARSKKPLSNEAGKLLDHLQQSIPYTYESLLPTLKQSFVVRELQRSSASWIDAFADLRKKADSAMTQKLLLADLEKRKDLLNYGLLGGFVIGAIFLLVGLPWWLREYASDRKRIVQAMNDTGTRPRRGK
jgi:hypothetical protein